MKNSDLCVAFTLTLAISSAASARGFFFFFFFFFVFFFVFFFFLHNSPLGRSALPLSGFGMFLGSTIVDFGIIVDCHPQHVSVK